MSDSSSLRILVTNDDGINADGLKVLERIARSVTKDVWVIAPETEQSGVAHSLTLHEPLRIRKINAKRYAVSGTPTDCVLLAGRVILAKAKKKIDLVLSGVNCSANVAEDVTYSGTIAAAMEGTLLGIPSIAMSQALEETESGFREDATPHWDTAEKYGKKLLRELVAIGWPENTLININFPALPPRKVRGVKVCRQGTREIGEKLEKRLDPRGRPYYWIGIDRQSIADQPGTDVAFMTEGYVTVTPLCLDLTNYKVMETLRRKVK